MTDTTIVRTETYRPGILVVQLVNTIIGIIEAALLLRIVLELFGASPASSFVAWVYDVTGSLLGPFASAFPNMSLGGGLVLDIVAILGMIAYAILGWVIIQILLFIFGAGRVV
jgi:YGGT family